MQHISIVINETKPKAYDMFQELIKILDKHNFDIIINDVKDNTDILFTIGGDGTMVRALKQYRNIPVVGINGGTLGFLTEINMDNLDIAIKQILNGDYCIEDCIGLECVLYRNHKIFKKNFSVNDIVISRSSALEMIRFDVSIGGKLIKQYNADGFIVSTPIGASAYSLSCGGPLIEPTSSLIELTPIAAHTLINRSIVVDDTKEIMLNIVDVRNNKHNALLSIDGEEAIELLPSDKIIIKKSKDKIKLVRLNNESFVSILSKKMFMV